MLEVSDLNFLICSSATVSRITAQNVKIDARINEKLILILFVKINKSGRRPRFTINVGNICIPNKLLISDLIFVVFFKSIYLKSSCSKPRQLINQFLVNLRAQNIIGIRTINLTLRLFSNCVAK